MAPDSERLDSLERTLERLAQELAEARRTLADLRPGIAPAVPAQPLPDLRPAIAPVVPPPPAGRARESIPPRPAARPAGRTQGELENLVGRYGALALAALTIVMGAGALVSWAISHGLMGPWVRVALGALLACAMAGAGWWLRARGSRGFGDTLVGLSLAIVHVVAWGAGPRLGLIPPWAALGIAVAASTALAAFALAEKEELLFAVGLGGALVAPFVMASGQPDFGVLAAYGLVVLTIAVRVIGDRPWWKAIGLVLAGMAVYTAGAGSYHSGVPWVDRSFAGAFAGAIGLMALAWERKPARPWVALGAATTMALAAHRGGAHADTRLDALFAAPDIQIMAIAGTALFLTAAREIEERREFASLWAMAIVVVPMLFLAAALSALGSVRGPVSGAVVLAWGLVYAAFSTREQGNRRGVLVTASGLAGLWAIVLLLDFAPDAVPVAVAAYAVLLATVSRRIQQPVVLLATGLSLLTAFWMAAAQLMERNGYTMTPFLSVASLGLASAVGASFFAARRGLPDRLPLFGRAFERDRVAALAASVLGFLWGHLELRRAFSADASTFLLVAFYASCGVLAIHQGRRRGEGRLRQVGLALAVLAALYAIVAASGVQEIGLRVGSYLLVGVFLLGVAWWYRGEGSSAVGAAGPRHTGTE